MLRYLVAIFVCLGAISGCAEDKEENAFDAALLYDLGGKFDKSFNEAAFRGLETFQEDTGIAVRDFEPVNEAQYTQALKRFARKDFDLIVAVGFSYFSALNEIAADYPGTSFTVIDTIVERPNVQSIVFEEHEGSFLVGMLAAMKTETGTVGFIGGMDTPLIRKFQLGFEEGVHHVDPGIRILVNMTGTTPAAWNDPIRGGELARGQYSRGADVIFASAGPTGLGVIQAAKDTGNLAIGVDSNQNHIAPGHVLTSMVKRVDVAVNEALHAALDGSWEPDVQRLGLAEGGVGYAVDQHNRGLLTEEMIARVESAKEKIIAGEIAVTDYMEREAAKAE